MVDLCIIITRYSCRKKFQDFVSERYSSIRHYRHVQIYFAGHTH